MGNPFKKWLKRLKAGDQSAFLPLYERTAPGLMRFLLWKTHGDKPLSEDIVQETYVRFLLHIDQIESHEELAVQSYLLRIAKNCFIDKVSRTAQSQHTHVAIEDAPTLVDPRDAQGSRQEQAIELRELAVAMEQLQEKDSEIIWLRDALGLSHREVANQVGITEQASRQAYVRAKRTLLSQFADRLGPGDLIGDGYVAEVP